MASSFGELSSDYDVTESNSLSQLCMIKKTLDSSLISFRTVKYESMRLPGTRGFGKSRIVSVFAYSVVM